MTEAPADDRLVVPVTARDHAQGPALAPVTIVEYGDFECPHCQAAAGHLRELRRALPDTLRLVFRHFPLAELHPHAERAAEAAEAAGAQGRFWEMHDYLLEHQDGLDDAAFQKAAKKLGLDGRRFQRELAEGAHAGRVRADYLGGRRSGTRGTPTLFFNGERYRGAWEFDALVARVVQVTGGAAQRGR